MRFRELEKIIKADGWYLANISGSHYQYKHPVKKGKVTIPFHRKDLDPLTAKTVLKQAGLDQS